MKTMNKSMIHAWLMHGLTILLLLIGLIPWFDHMPLNLCGYKSLYPLIAYGSTIPITINATLFLRKRYRKRIIWILPSINLLLFILPQEFLISDAIHGFGLFLVSGWIILLSIYPDMRQIKILAITASAALASMGLTLNINYFSEFLFLIYLEYVMVVPLFKTTFHR